MSQETTIRAWKDADFRNSLSEKERGLLLEHPVGIVELTDVELKSIGGMTGCKCGGWTCTYAVKCGGD